MNFIYFEKGKLGRLLQLIYTQFCRFFYLQIHLIIDVKDIFYRPEFKHKKFYFVNETAELYWKSKAQNYICRYEIEIF